MEEYHHKVNNNITKIIENMSIIIRTSKIRDPTHTSREEFQNAVCVRNIVQASENLLKMIAEIKLSATLGDFEKINKEKLIETAQIVKRNNEVCGNIDTLYNDVNEALMELESHYYHSKWRKKP